MVGAADVAYGCRLESSRRPDALGQTATPSEYFRGHIHVGTQPMHEPPKSEQIYQMLEMLHSDETLVFCTDFPHWDWNDPVTVLPKLDERTHRRIFAENALDLLRIS